MGLTCECGEKATNFHSKCCGVHMEGVITEEGELQAVCENCGKYVGTIVNRKKIENIANHIEHIMSEWNNRETLFEYFNNLEQIYVPLCYMIGKIPEDFHELRKNAKICD